MEPVFVAGIIGLGIVMIVVAFDEMKKEWQKHRKVKHKCYHEIRKPTSSQHVQPR